MVFSSLGAVTEDASDEEEEEEGDEDEDGETPLVTFDLGFELFR